MEDDIRNYLPTVMFRGTSCMLLIFFVLILILNAKGIVSCVNIQIDEPDFQ